MVMMDVLINLVGATVSRCISNILKTLYNFLCQLYFIKAGKDKVELCPHLPLQPVSGTDPV